MRESTGEKIKYIVYVGLCIYIFISPNTEGKESCLCTCGFLSCNPFHIYLMPKKKPCDLVETYKPYCIA